MGGRVVDFTPIIKPLRGPTCMFKTSKISTQVKVVVEVGVELGNNNNIIVINNINNNKSNNNNKYIYIY